MKSIDCSGCHAPCCRIMNVITEDVVGPEIFETIKGFDSGDGTCIHLGEDSRCKIYDKRPQICRVKITPGRTIKQLRDDCKILKEMVDNV